MSSFTKAAKKQTKKMKKATKKARNSVTGTSKTAAKKTKKKGHKTAQAASDAAKATGKAARTAVKKTGKAIRTGARKTAKAANMTFRIVGKAIWWPISFAWTLVSTAVALASYAVSWLLSLTSWVLFRAGVGFAMFAMLLTGTAAHAESKKPAKTTSFIVTDADRPTPDYRDPDSFVRDDEYVEAPLTQPEIARGFAPILKQQFEDAEAKGNHDRMSYYFGRYQAAEAIAAGTSDNRGWALVAKQLNAPGTPLLRKEAKRGWDEEFAKTKPLITTA